MPNQRNKPEHECAGWEVVCPDGRLRGYPYHNLGDAEDHAELASDRKHFAKRGSCRPAPNPSPIELAQPPCPGGKHTVRPVTFRHPRVKSHPRVKKARGERARGKA